MAFLCSIIAVTSSRAGKLRIGFRNDLAKSGYGDFGVSGDASVPAGEVGVSPVASGGVVADGSAGLAGLFSAGVSPSAGVPSGEPSGVVTSGSADIAPGAAGVVPAGAAGAPGVVTTGSGFTSL